MRAQSVFMTSNVYSQGLTPGSRVRSGTFIAIFRPADTVRSEPIAHAEISSRPRSESRADSGAELILSALRQQPLSAEDLSQKMGRKTVSGAFKRSVRDLLKREFIERTIPDKPNSRLQKHRLTAKGLALAGNGKK